MTEFYFTGNDLIELGITPGPKFGPLLKAVNQALQSSQNLSEEEAHAAIAAVIDAYKAQEAAETAEKAARIVPLRDTPVTIATNIDASTEDEVANVAAVMAAMSVLARTPTVEKAAVMPDACPAGAIPVGGVAAARNAIHPGWHSADICCSMYATEFGEADPKTVLDAVFTATHFGPGGRARHAEAAMPAELLARLTDGNPFLADKKLQIQARSHLMTQGDGLSYAA